MSCVSLFQREQPVSRRGGPGRSALCLDTGRRLDKSTSASALGKRNAPYHRVSPAVGGCQAKLQVKEEPRPGRHQTWGCFAGRRRRGGWDKSSTTRRQGGLGVKEPPRSGRMGQRPDTA